MLNTFVARCPNCKSRCPEVVENLTKTPSRCVLVEVNKFTRKSVKNELDEKIKAWGNALPPHNLTSPPADIDFKTYKMVKFLQNGAFYLHEDREYIPIRIRDQESSGDEEVY